MYIASCSFGKDSLATILLALKHNEPLDRVVFAEVMYDHQRGISGEIPEHIEWIYGTAIPRLKSMGVHVDVVRDKDDYRHFFCSAVGGKFAGLLYGFPIGGKCVINRNCKLRPIHQYYKQIGGKITQYVGIAADEPKRLARLKSNQVSLMAKYGITETMAMEMCREAGLLSPIYDTGTRGGCWFCPNARINSLRLFRKTHNDLWQELVELGKTPNLCSYGFKYGTTIDQLEQRFRDEELQLNLFT